MTVRFRIIIGGRKKVLQSGFHTKFPEEMEVSSSTVYWYDDAPWGVDVYRSLGKSIIRMLLAIGLQFRILQRMGYRRAIRIP